MLSYLLVFLAVVTFVGYVDLGPKVLGILFSSFLTVAGTTGMMLSAGNPGLKNRFKLFFGSIAAIACSFFITLGI